MGSFIGHLVPGLYFIILAIWWSANIFSRYFNAKFNQKGKWKGVRRYKSSVSFGTDSMNANGTPQNVPFEVWLKLAASGIGIFGEYYTALDEKWQFEERHNLQHIMMYAFFAIHPIMELLYYFKLDNVPPKLDYLGAILAFCIEGFLFHEHLHGRANMDVQMHTYQVYAIMSCAVASALEMYHVHDVRPAIGRAVCTLLQGTWFIQIGATLYPPIGERTWKLDDHGEMMLITVIFTLHLSAAIAFQAIMAVVIFTIKKRQPGFQPLKTDATDLSESDDDANIGLPLMTTNDIQA